MGPEPRDEYLFGTSFSNIDEEINNLDELESGKLLQCEECEKSYKSKSALYLHTSSKHAGIVYSCQYCGYKAKYKGHLKQHKESVHEGVKYQCNPVSYTHLTLPTILLV